MELATTILMCVPFVCLILHAILSHRKIRRLDKKLGHASGALADIQTIVTDCVGKDDPARVHELSEVILSRILTSADRPRTKPSWFRHAWEEKLWCEYLGGKLKACASDKPCIDVAEALAD
jgi:hypothetical protein